MNEIDVWIAWIVSGAGVKFTVIIAVAALVFHAIMNIEIPDDWLGGKEEQDELS